MIKAKWHDMMQRFTGGALINVDFTGYFQVVGIDLFVSNIVKWRR